MPTLTPIPAEKPFMSLMGAKLLASLNLLENRYFIPASNCKYLEMLNKAFIPGSTIKKGLSVIFKFVLVKIMVAIIVIYIAHAACTYQHRKREVYSVFTK